MNINFTDQQNVILNHQGSALVLGAAGSGKSTLLIEKAARLIASSVKPEHILVMTFSWRSMMLLDNMMAKRAPDVEKAVKIGTLRDFAIQSVEASRQEKLNFISNNKARELLVGVCRSIGFKGSLTEAEHAVRTFKSRARRPQESEPQFDVWDAYQKKLEELGVVDRHDVVRQHIIGMRNEEMPPCAVKYILVDNIQDATQIQLVWLKEHMRAGVQVLVMGDDDLTAFSRDGALGMEAFSMLQEQEGMTLLTLPETFRVPENLSPALEKTARLLKKRKDKVVKPLNRKKAKFELKTFDSVQEETQFLFQSVVAALKSDPKQRIGVIVRNDFDANALMHLLRKQNIPTACYARLLWEKPAPCDILNLLRVLLLKAEAKHLQRVLRANGVEAGLVQQVVHENLNVTQWLCEGAKVSDSVDLGTDDGRHFSMVRRRLLGYIQLMTGADRSKADPRTVFKAAVADLMPRYPTMSQQNALLAVDMLLSLQGRLADILPRLEEETLPDMRSNVVVAPVREVRNMEFDTLFLPRLENETWPTKVEGYSTDLEHERRLFYLAITRAKGNITATYVETPSLFVSELQNAVNRLQSK